MTKWFDTNYHYILPEFTTQTNFKLYADKLISQVQEAKQIQKQVKLVILGPVSYLWRGKAKDNSDKLALLDNLVATYKQLLITLAETA